MTVRTVGPIALSGVPTGTLNSGIYNAFQQNWSIDTDAGLAAQLNIGDWITKYSGSVTVKSDIANTSPLAVRLYFAPGTGYQNLGTVTPGQTETFPFSFTKAEAELGQLNNAADPIFSVYFIQQPGSPNTKAIIQSATLSLEVSDVQPSFLTVQAADDSQSDSNYQNLAIGNLLNLVTINGSSLPLTGYEVHIELEGAPTVGITSVMNNTTGTYSMAMASNVVAPVTLVQAYRVRVFKIIGGDGGPPILGPEVTPAAGSDSVGLVSFQLLASGEPPTGDDCSYPIFDWVLPYCNGKGKGKG